jgi:hypothetical protein
MTVLVVDLCYRHTPTISSVYKERMGCRVEVVQEEDMEGGVTGYWQEGREGSRGLVFAGERDREGKPRRGVTILNFSSPVTSNYR